MVLKDKLDLWMKGIGLGGAVIAFVVGLCQWHRDQAWKRQELLDDLIAHFESDSNIRIAKAAVDWRTRDVRSGDTTLRISNTGAVLALRIVGDDTQKKLCGLRFGCSDYCSLTPEQIALREAYDALLSFFQRLEVAVTNKKVDAEPCADYFNYWLDRLLTFRMHTVETGCVCNTREELIAGYICAYGSSDSMLRLCRALKLKPTVYAKLKGD